MLNLNIDLIKIMFSIFISMPIFITPAFAWDFSKHSIPLEEILSGGPPKDGIPALTDPKFIAAYEVKYLESQERILGIFLNGEAKAYPLKIVNWHEILNDIVGGKPVVITYCPLTGSGLAYDAEINKKRVIFGVSGNLYNSNVLFYDHLTESLWSQLKQEAVAGKMTATKLKPLVVFNTTWKDWQKRYPDTKVLSLNTGYTRDYKRDPYQEYIQTDEIYFPVSSFNKKLPKKERVLGVIVNAEAKAYPFSVLDKVFSPLLDEVGEEKIFIYFDKEEKSAWVESENGEVMPSVHVYWFAWYAFYPETKIFLLNQ